MSRLIGMLGLAGIGMIVMGGYDVFIQATAFKEPTTISVAELETKAPFNRHLVITGGQATFRDGVVYYKERRQSKVSGSEVYFIPVQDASLIAYRSLAPILLLQLSDKQMKAIDGGKTFDNSRISGVRVTAWEMESKVEELLAERFGKPAVKQMIILAYEKQVTGVVGGLAQVVTGVCAVTGMIALSGGRRK